MKNKTVWTNAWSSMQLLQHINLTVYKTREHSVKPNTKYSREQQNKFRLSSILTNSNKELFANSSNAKLKENYITIFIPIFLH